MDDTGRHVSQLVCPVLRSLPLSGSVSYYMTSYTAFRSSVGGLGWASELPQRVGSLCTNPIGSMRGPVQNVQSKHNLLLQNTILIS
jgi:hypothetical protein